MSGYHWPFDPRDLSVINEPSPALTPPEEEPPPPVPPPEIPQFPEHPPKPSAFEVIPRQFLIGNQQFVPLGFVNALLDRAFRQCGYGEVSYYAVKDGFAVASRIEQINPDGTAAYNRWSLDTSYMEHFSLVAYLQALFKAQRPGHYRVIVFVITPHPLTQSKITVSGPEAEAWVSGGANTFPKEIGSREYSSDYNCTALIYEFESVRNQPARFVDPSELTGYMHLQRAGLIAALSQSR